jgi:hypothetical protein
MIGRSVAVGGTRSGVGWGRGCRDVGETAEEGVEGGLIVVEGGAFVVGAQGRGASGLPRPYLSSMRMTSSSSVVDASITMVSSRAVRRWTVPGGM